MTSGGYAGRLADALHERLGSKNVFQDVLDIGPGQDYAVVIDRALDDSDALLAVIGPGWLSAADPQGSARLFAADDYVRQEIARALDRDVRVVPVLVGGASLPTAAELPGALQRLAHPQAVVLRDENWHQDASTVCCGHCAVSGRRRPRATAAGWSRSRSSSRWPRWARAHGGCGVAAGTRTLRRSWRRARR